jgi:tRNA(fMet)-specific endonuclease VapC
MIVLLDTSAYVAFKVGRDEVVEIIAAAERILFSPVVLGELMFGFRNGTRFKQNMEELDQFIRHESVEFIQIGRVTADRYSRIASHLKQQGTPIPTNDIWIAAQTMECGAELIASDNHFEKVPGLVYTRF